MRWWRMTSPCIGDAARLYAYCGRAEHIPKCTGAIELGAWDTRAHQAPMPRPPTKPYFISRYCDPYTDNISITFVDYYTIIMLNFVTYQL